MSPYVPYRSKILTAEQLKSLTTVKPGRMIRDTLIDWSVILLCWVIVAFYPVWYVVVLAIPIIGCHLYGLMIIAHDGLHRRLFASKKANDRYCNMLLLGPICAVTHMNRLNHMDHHKLLATDNDPDRYKYLTRDKRSLLQFMLFITGIAYIFQTLRNVFLKPSSPSPSHTKKHYNTENIIVIIAWQVLLIGGLSYSIGWWAYPVLFAFPFYIFAYLADTIRVFCEHSQPENDTPETDRKRLITYTSSWLERKFFAPHNMNYHTAHHLWPSIPYYNLPEANRYIQESEFVQELEWRDSYLKYILRYFEWMLSQNKVDYA